MSSTDTAAPVPTCCFCCCMPAVVYCRADAAGLCLPCDRHVHGANMVSRRHFRAPLCEVCRAAAASVRCGGDGAARFLCLCCDVQEQHQHGELMPPPLHDRETVEGYSGCPSVGELEAILGVRDDTVAAGSDGDEAWWSVWEELQVVTIDDVVVPTTSCQAWPPDPSHLVLSQEPELVLRGGAGQRRSQAAREACQVSGGDDVYPGDQDAEPASVDQLPLSASSDDAIGNGSFGAHGAEASCAAANLHLPSCQHHQASIANQCNEVLDPLDAQNSSHEKVPVSSSDEPRLPPFEDVHSIDGGQDHAPTPTQADKPNNRGYDIVYPDRRTVILRYKEKRKNRIFGNQIRYASRKARANGMVRIRGRFAKSN